MKISGEGSRNSIPEVYCNEIPMEIQYRQIRDLARTVSESGRLSMKIGSACSDSEHKSWNIKIITYYKLDSVFRSHARFPEGTAASDAIERLV
jgi:hypothetical protein